MSQTGFLRLGGVRLVGGRLLLLVLAASVLRLLVIGARQRPDALDQQGPAAAELAPPAEGRYRGRPISQLWANGLPEQAWFTDPQCRRLVTRFTRDDCLEVVRLASFPRSGNTWTRYLLEAATGLFTGVGGPNSADYRRLGEVKLSESELWNLTTSENRTELARMGYLGEPVPWTQGSTIVLKTHSLPQPWNATEDKLLHYDWAAFAPNASRRAIVIIRDPFKALVSLRTYFLTKSVLNNDTDASFLFDGKKWETYVMYYAQRWYDLNEQWVTTMNATYVVAYERLVHNTMEELEGMLKFLDVEPSPERMECVRRHLEGKVHNKKHRTVPADDIFPLWLRADVWSHIHQLNLVLRDNGYRELPLKEYSFSDEFRDIGL